MSSRTLAFWATFAASAAVIYVVAMELNLAALTYHPRLGDWALGAERPKNGPAIYWYGWMATSALGGAILGAVAAVLAGSLRSRLWLHLAWVVPTGAMLAASYFMMPFFTRG